MNLQVQAAGSDGIPKTFVVPVAPGTKLGAVRERLAAQGMQFLDARRMPDAPTPAPMAQGEVSQSAPTTTTTTTTPHPVAEGIGATVGGLLGSALPGGMAARVPAAGAGAVAARSLMEQRRPTGREAAGAFGRGAAGQMLGEGAVQAVKLPFKMLAGKVIPAAKAAGNLSEAIGSKLPLPTALKNVQGRMVPLEKVALSGEKGRGFMPHPSDQLNTVRAWWQTYQPGGSEAITQAWTKLNPKMRETLFGPFAEDMGTLVKSLAPIGTGRGTLQGLGLFSGNPLMQTASAVDAARSTVLPKLFQTAVTRPRGAQAIGSLASTIEKTAPTVGRATRASITGPTAGALGSTKSERRRK